MDALTSQYNVLLEKQQQLNNVIPSRLEKLREVLQEAKKNLENGNPFFFNSLSADSQANLQWFRSIKLERIIGINAAEEQSTELSERTKRVLRCC
jgi:hypothetical protein